MECRKRLRQVVVRMEVSRVVLECHVQKCLNGKYRTAAFGNEKECHSRAPPLGFAALHTRAL